MCEERFDKIRVNALGILDSYFGQLKSERVTRSYTLNCVAFVMLLQEVARKGSDRAPTFIFHAYIHLIPESVSQ